MEEIEKPMTFILTTLYYRPDYLFMNKRSPKKLPVFLAGSQWNFTSISVLLNELHGFIPFDRSYQIKESPNCKVIAFKFQQEDNHEFKISVKISNSINVKISTKMITENWDEKRSHYYSLISLK